MKARKIAFESLKSVFIKQGYTNLVLRKNLKGIDIKDKGLITEIVYGTLRNYIYLKSNIRNLYIKIYLWK